MLGLMNDLKFICFIYLGFFMLGIWFFEEEILNFEFWREVEGIYLSLYWIVVVDVCIGFLNVSGVCRF